MGNSQRDIQPADSAPRPPGISPLWALVCALGGGALALAGWMARDQMDRRRTPSPPARLAVVAPQPPSRAAAPAQQTPTPKVATAKPPAPPAAPLSPLAGDITALGKLPKDWKTAVLPDQAPPAQGEVRLVEMSVRSSDASNYASIAKACQATLQPIKDFVGDRLVPVDALLFYCPPAKTQALLDKLAKSGGAMTSDWKGAPSERDGQLAENAETALQDLERKRNALLVRYFEDAIPVKQVDDQIADVTAAIDGYRAKNSSKLDAVKLVLEPG